ncbi:MAG: hypothetical protein QMC67_12015 [Candidatus Wallbacteria bacterium]
MKNGFFGKKFYYLENQNKKKPLRINYNFKCNYLSCFLFFVSLWIYFAGFNVCKVFASPDCHTEGLLKFNIINLKESCDTVFFPGRQSNSSAAPDKYDSMFSVCAPLFFELSEKYHLYPLDTQTGQNNDSGIQKYMAKAPNINLKFVITCIMSHFFNPLDCAVYDAFSNAVSFYPLNKKIQSEIKIEKLPVFITFLDSSFRCGHCLLYGSAGSGDYEVYFVNDPFLGMNGYSDMYLKVICYDKSGMDFKLLEIINKKVTARKLLLVAWHPVSWYFKSLDQFEKLREGSFGIENAYDYLKLLIEKKIIGEPAKLKKYRIYNFLPQSRQNALINLIQAVKKAIVDPELAPYINTFDSSLGSLQVNMAQKNKIAQEKLVLKKFNAFDERFEKLKIDMKPRHEFDFIFRKVQLKN